MDFERDKEKESIACAYLSTPYYFDFTGDKDIDKSLYEPVEVNYQIPGSNNFVKITLYIKLFFMESFGKFYMNWEEQLTDNNIFWYNANINKSTWDNPIFILLSLIDNRINTNWVPLYWESKYDSFLQINLKDVNMIDRILYLDRRTQVITDKDPGVKENVLKENEEEEEEITIKDLLKENIIKNLTEKKEENENNTSILSKELSETTSSQIDKLKEEYKNEIEDFKALLKDKHIGMFAIYDKELPKLIYDPRYSKLHNDLRKIVFEDYVKNNSSISEKLESTKVLINRKQGQEGFKALLKKAIEKGDINLNTSFIDFQGKYEDDPAFKQTLNIDREFLFNETKLKLKKLLEERKNSALKKFNEMLERVVTFDLIENDTTHKEIKSLVKKELEYKLIGSSSERKSHIMQFLEKMKKLKSKTKNISGYEDSNIDFSNKKKKLEIDLARDEFVSLLKEKVRTEISWEEAERKLGNELRWKNDNLTGENRIELFKDYIYNMREIRKRAFRRLLEEKIGLNQEITWHEAQHMLQRDERYKEVSQKDRQLMYQDYMTAMQEKIAHEFAMFLEETNLINKDSPTEGPPFRDLITRLSTDTRCQRMFRHPDKRDKLIRAKIKNLKYKFEKQQRLDKKNARGDANYKREEHTTKWEKDNLIK